jgi:hypothetical protein
MIASHVEMILIVTGLYTVLAVTQFIVPRLVLSRVTFGTDTADPFTLLMARHWAVLAALVGGLLVYAAYHPEVRGPAMVVAAVEKLVLAGLIFFGGWPRTPTATRTAVIDAVIALVLVLCLAGV